jgi:hypothetical protein
MKPRLQSLLVANQVYQDLLSRSFIIAGTFNCVYFRQQQTKVAEDPQKQITVPQEKSIQELRTSGSPWLFFSITDVSGEVECSVRYVSLQDNQVLFSSEKFRIISKDRLKTIEQRLELPPLPVNGPGQYALEFFANDEMIGALRILAVPVEFV